MAYQDWYTYQLVDLQGNVIEEELEGVSSGVIDGNVATPIRWTGSLNLEAPPAWDLWKTRIRPIYHRTGRDPEVVGTFHARPDSWREERGRHSTKLNLYDLTIHPQEDSISNTWVEPVGGIVTARVEAILQSIGLQTAITPSTETLRRSLVFEDTVTKLRVINDMLEAAGFFSLHTNPLGQFQVRPYAPPWDRPTVYWLTTRPDAEHTTTVAGAYPQTLPNRVIAKAPGDGDAPDLVSESEDLLDAIQTGTWRTRVYEGIEATSQAVLQQHAHRLLAEARSTSVVVERELLPGPLAINDILGDSSGQRYTTETIRRVLQTGQVMQVGIREVKG